MIKVKNLSYSINGKKVINNINLDFNDGEIIVITGENGAGKTTILNLIAGILPITTGKIILDDKDITDFTIDQRANYGLSYAFQQPVQFKGLTVKNLFEIATKNKQNIYDICKYLSQLGLCARDYLNREFNSSLSGGELKRIEIALTIARNCQNNLFDEPEAGIDLWSFDSLISVFKQLKQNNKTVIIVSHQKKILEIADKIIVLSKNGIIKEMGSPNKILKNITSLTCIKLKGGNLC